MTRILNLLRLLWMKKSVDTTAIKGMLLLGPLVLALWRGAYFWSGGLAQPCASLGTGLEMDFRLVVRHPLASVGPRLYRISDSILFLFLAKGGGGVLPYFLP